MGATQHKIGFIGAGTVGSVLSEGLARADYPIVSIYSRSPDSAARMVERCAPHAAVAPSAQAVADACDMVFITTPDDAISLTAASISWQEHHRVVHCSGALSAGCLEPVRKAGGAVGGFHPFQTFVEPDVLLLSDVTIGIEAQDALRDELKEMAAAIDCRWVILSAEDKALYHVSGVLACNYIVTLIQQSVALWESIGIDRADAVQGLMTLLRTTVDNLEEFGMEESLTGPIARGDSGTVRRHLDQLGTRAPALEEAYRELGILALDIAKRKGSISEISASAVGQVLGANHRTKKATAGVRTRSRQEVR